MEKVVVRTTTFHPNSKARKFQPVNSGASSIPVVVDWNFVMLSDGKLQVAESFELHLATWRSDW
jgi:hypothetical protein